MFFCLGGTQVDSPKDSTTECLTLSRQEGNLDSGPGAGSPPGPWALMAAAQWAVSYHPLSTLEATVRTDSRIPLQRTDHSVSREVCRALHTRCVSHATSAEGYARHGLSALLLRPRMYLEQVSLHSGSQGQLEPQHHSAGLCAESAMRVAS